jgi:hypothetical protein
VLRGFPEVRKNKEFRAFQSYEIKENALNENKRTQN